jgi:hypothetical protein
MPYLNGCPNAEVNNEMYSNVNALYPLSLFWIPGVYSASNKNEYQKQKNKIFLESKAQPARRADKLAAICEPIV